MEYIKRHYQDLSQYWENNKVLVILGPRRAGKTTLINEFLKTTKLKYKLESGDNLKIQETLSSQNFDKILSFCEGYELIIIDEAQNIPNIGMGLKIIIDNLPNIKVITTGSSSFELANQVGEPLVGRKKTLFLFPFAQLELKNIYNKFELQEKLEEFLIFGNYPEIFTLKNKQQKISNLLELTNSYLLKDILSLENIQKPKQLLKLLKLLAFQVGSEVSCNELSNQLDLDLKTVQRYLDLLEKTFVIKSLSGFSRNLRKEVTKKEKYYFYDLGIRNAIINNFNDLETRNDIGSLWENFIFIERMKFNNYTNNFVNTYFWRTYDKKEIDLIEEKDGELFAYEFKWNAKQKNKIKIPQEFLDTYNNSSFQVIDKNNYLDFL